MSSLDMSVKLKQLEMEVTKLQSRSKMAEERIVELQKYIISLVQQHTIMAERLSSWPWLPRPQIPEEGANKS